MIVKLTDEIAFPDPRQGEPDGWFAVGGDLSVDRLLLAYSYGIFPWYAFRWYDEIHWYCPMQRFVIFPNEIHISRSMRKLMRKGRYSVSINRDFHNVIRLCGELRHDEEGAWLGDDMLRAYEELHRQGFAASVEVWEADRLVGGIYGVNIGSCFFGESMFSLVPNGSKVALIALAQYMAENGGRLIDCQFETPHLRSMGGRFISYDAYMDILQE